MIRAGLVACVLVGCTGSVTDDTNECADPSPPAAPTIANLGSSEYVIDDPVQLAIQVSDLVDPDGDPFVELEVGIWHGGERIWTATTTDPTVHLFAFADGTLEGTAAVTGMLDVWDKYVIRARYRVETAGGCVSDGAWSDDLGFRTDDGSNALFDPSIVRDYRVDLSPESVASINAEAFTPGCVPYLRNYYDGTLRVEDQVFAGSGVKVKGGCGSNRDLNGKAGLKINMSWDSPAVEGCPEQRRLLGLSKMTFNNMVQDPSMTHELLAYSFYRRMGVAVPRAALMRLYVNDQYFGVYLNLETIDRRFLSRHFDSNGGMLYEGTYWCDLLQGNVHDDDTGCITREFMPDACSSPDTGDDPMDFSLIHELIANLDALPPGGFYPAVTALVDMDSLFSMWAVEGILAHWDGYVFEIVNNYRIYHDPSTGLWTIIPTGVDQTFQRPGFDAFGVTGRLATQCMAEPACAAAFGARLRQALAVFTDMNMSSIRQQLRGQLDGLLVPDPGREFSQGSYEQAQTDTQSFIDGRGATVDAQLTARGY